MFQQGGLSNFPSSVAESSHPAVANTPEMTRMWILLRKWQEAVLSCVESPYTNRFVEGLTNRIKVLKRIAYASQHRA